MTGSCDDMREVILPYRGGHTTKRRAVCSRAARRSPRRAWLRPRSARRRSTASVLSRPLLRSPSFRVRPAIRSCALCPRPARPRLRPGQEPRSRDAHARRKARAARSVHGRFGPPQGGSRFPAFVAARAAAHKAAPKLPIVGLMNANHLISAGLAQSMGRPGGMITGLSSTWTRTRSQARRAAPGARAAREAHRFVGLREEWERPYVAEDARRWRNG